MKRISLNGWSECWPSQVVSLDSSRWWISGNSVLYHGGYSIWPLPLICSFHCHDCMVSHNPLLRIASWKFLLSRFGPFIFRLSYCTWKFFGTFDYYFCLVNVISNILWNNWGPPRSFTKCFHTMWFIGNDSLKFPS